MRIVLTTGKGGVGKTTVAAATAVHAAQCGHRTLVLSTDAAHSLADVLDAPLGHSVTEVAPRLEAQQLDGRRRLEESWSDIKGYLVELLGWAGADAIDAAELASLPGLDEVFALENLRDHAASGRYDLIVVDCAPTAETLRLLALPEILGWYLERVFPTHRRVARMTRPVLRRATSMPLAEDGLFDSFSRFAAGLDGVRELLADRSVTTVRLVTTPEQVVVAETRRTYAYLALFGYAVDALIVNRLVDETHSGPFFDEWRVAATPCARCDRRDLRLPGSARRTPRRIGAGRACTPRPAGQAPPRRCRSRVRPGLGATRAAVRARGRSCDAPRAVARSGWRGGEGRSHRPRSRGDRGRVPTAGAAARQPADLAGPVGPP